MQKVGVLLQSGGLAPISRGAPINGSRGKLSVTDGPFAETKEVIGGFAIIEVGSREEAVRFGRRFMEVQAAILGPSHERRV
jgi:hypothetical protein